MTCALQNIFVKKYIGRTTESFMLIQTHQGNAGNFCKHLSFSIASWFGSFILWNGRITVWQLLSRNIVKHSKNINPRLIQTVIPYS